MQYHETGHYYTLGHLSQITGLTDRTLRSYLKNGILEGEKINGIWHFSEEQLDAFFRHPAVRPSIQSKTTPSSTTSCWTPKSPSPGPASFWTYLVWTVRRHPVFSAMPSATAISGIFVFPWMPSNPPGSFSPGPSIKSSP